jgi:Tfp pilus assembly protein PilV
MFKNFKKQPGFFLIEVIIASALAGGILISLLSLVQNTVEISKRSLEKTQVGYLLEEGAEAVKTIRDASWSGNIVTLSNGTPYYLLWNGTEWRTSTTPSTIDIFTRTIIFEEVSRDSNSDIVAVGGTVDPRTRKVTVTVDWTTPKGPQSESLVFYIADIRT